MDAGEGAVGVVGLLVVGAEGQVELSHFFRTVIALLNQVVWMIA